MRRFISIGNRLKELRGNDTQEEFCKKIKMSVRTYQTYESGERAPKGPALERIAKVGKVTPEDIMTGGKNRVAYVPTAGFSREDERVLDKVRQILKTGTDTDRRQLRGTIEELLDGIERRGR